MTADSEQVEEALLIAILNTDRVWGGDRNEDLRRERYAKAIKAAALCEDARAFWCVYRESLKR